MTIVDWRDAPAPTMQALYAREQAYWGSALAWDASSSWDTIEQARTTWGLPGLMAVDASGAILGWTFYFFQHGIFEVGGLTADSPATAGALLDALVVAAEAAEAQRLSLFICERAPGLGDALAARGFLVEPHRYLVRSTGAARSSENDVPPVGRAWRAGDVADAAALLRSAYGPSGARFAPRDRPEDWIRYVGGLVEQNGCGLLLPEASRVLRSGDGMAALLLMTEVADRTAHIAQVAVDPARRREGLAAALVRDASRRAENSGYTSLSLIVADANAPARALYEGLGFAPRARFVAARRPVQPRRLTSVALASGGATTLR